MNSLTAKVVRIKSVERFIFKPLDKFSQDDVRDGLFRYLRLAESNNGITGGLLKEIVGQQLMSKLVYDCDEGTLDTQADAAKLATSLVAKKWMVDGVMLIEIKQTFTIYLVKYLGSVMLLNDLINHEFCMKLNSVSEEYVKLCLFEHLNLDPVKNRLNGRQLEFKAAYNYMNELAYICCDESRQTEMADYARSLVLDWVKYGLPLKYLAKAYSVDVLRSALISEDASSTLEVKNSDIASDTFSNKSDKGAINVIEIDDDDIL